MQTIITTARRQPPAPLFRAYALEELAALTGYSLDYLVQLREGRKPITRLFRRKVASILRRPEAELFEES